MNKTEIKNLIDKMTLEEKAALCSGRDGNYTKAVDRLGIPSVYMIDGPMGLRKEKAKTETELDWFNSYPATCMPSPSVLANTFNCEMAELYGDVLGKECLSENVQILLAPGINIKRHPLCGRNFEYFSEDPQLTAEIATSYIKGLQKNGPGVCLKHFAVNNQETNRAVIDAKIDDRALFENYLYAFRYAINHSSPKSIMAAYNRVNGEFCCQNKRLLTDILRNQFGFEGFVVSDWGAVDDRVESLSAGLNLEMPYSGGYRDQLVAEAVRKGKISEKVLDDSIYEYLKAIFEIVENSKYQKADYEQHHAAARRIAEEGIVLLKNADEILPIKNPDAYIAVIGDFAVNQRYKGGGSSNVNPYKMENPLEELKKVFRKADYYLGYKAEQTLPDPYLEAECLQNIGAYEYVVMFCAVNLSQESEGKDRKDLFLPDCQLRLMRLIQKQNRNLIVILSNGGAVDVSFRKYPKAIIEAGLSGQAFGSALTSILCGKVNPSGRLNESIPQRLEDIVSYENIFGDGKSVVYGESVFTGYKYYDKKKIKTAYPFGYGLSYTSFRYTNFTAKCNGDQIDVSVDVENVGEYDGKTVVGIYFGKKDSRVAMPEKQLRAFKKVDLKVNEKKTVWLEIEREALAYYDIFAEKFIVEGGKYQIYLCENAEKVLAQRQVHVRKDALLLKKIHRNINILTALRYDNGKQVMQDMIDKFNRKSGKNIPVFNIGNDFVEMVMFNTPLRNLIGFYGGKITDADLDGYIERYNARY